MSEKLLLDKEMVYSVFEQRRKRKVNYVKKDINLFGYEIKNVPVIKRKYETDTNNLTEDTIKKVYKLIEYNSDKHCLNYDEI